MSVRIYQLSKELDMTNKEIITLLQERGLDVNSPSNTIPNIYAESFREEFKKKVEKGAVVATKEAETPQPKEEAKPVEPEAPKMKFVKSAEDIEAEKKRALESKPAVSTIISKPEIPQTQAAQRPSPVLAAGSGAAGAPKAPPRIPGIAGSAPKLPQIVPGSKETQGGLASGSASIESSNAAVVNTQEVAEKNTSSASTTGQVNILKCKPPIIVREFAIILGLKPFRLISELMEMGIFASMNQPIDENVAIRIAKKHGFELEIQHRKEVQQQTPQQTQQQQQEAAARKAIEEEIKSDEKRVPRPPIVCVLGHVDHGKTTLLDTIRKTSVVTGEAGGITQHIGAYQVVHDGHKITFIDTPGHAAFSKMRQRGADVTDIAILVVAADDGFKPQTDEALKFAQKAGVPIVVAINKMDAPGANIDRVKQQLQERGIAPEDWGGETLCTPVSALKGTNIDTLLELILLQAEVEELKANPDCQAEGVIIESQIEVGRGSTASVIIRKGTLKIGDNLVCGGAYCKVKAMLDDKGGNLKEAPPSTPVKVLGWTDIPEAGMVFKALKNEKEAKREAEEYAHKSKLKSLVPEKQEKMDLQNLLDAIASVKEKTLKVIIKGDVHGSVEALSASLQGIKSDKIKLELLNSEVGLISKNDVKNANAAGAVIVGFNTKFETGTAAQAKHENVQVIQHNIIYELIDQIRDLMTEMLDPELKENKLGAAEVRQIFAVAKGVVAGCMVTEGKINRDAFARILRGKKSEPVHQGKVVTLKRFKEDASEVRAGYECGIQISGFNDYKEGDIIECFEIQKIRPSL
jgi:translation initiation factor IF-2